MDQRIKLANVVAMYRLNAGWMKDHAFPNRPQNQSIYNAFVAANLAGSEVALTKEDAARGYCVVAPYEMTKGSLPRVQLLETEDPSTVACSLISTFASLSGKTVAELSLDLIEQNTFLQDGDQLSFIVNFQYNDVAGIRAICRAFEITLDTTSEESVENLPIGDILLTQAGTVSGTYNLAFSVDDITAYAGSVYHGDAVIVSRKASSGIQVSPATLALYGDDRFYATMTSEARKRLARNSYGVSAEPFLVPGTEETITNPLAFSFTFPAESTAWNNGIVTVREAANKEEALAWMKAHVTFNGGNVTVDNTGSDPQEPWVLTDGTEEIGYINSQYNQGNQLQLRSSAPATLQSCEVDGVQIEP